MNLKIALGIFGGIVIVLIGLGCNQGEVITSSELAKQDQLVGYYILSDNTWKYDRPNAKLDTLIPVFKLNETYYSVGNRGVEVPFKPCPEGLEWAITPSSMTGTMFIYAGPDRYFLRILDRLLQANSDDRAGDGTWSIKRIDKPVWLLDAKAAAPRTKDDFVGWYQAVWAPYLRWEIRKEDDKYLLSMQMPEKEGAWKSREGSAELTPRDDELGFMMNQGLHDKTQLIYNSVLGRFEITNEEDKRQPSIIRMPLARIPAPPSPQSDAVAMTYPRIGIPCWN